METILLTSKTNLPFAKGGCVIALGFFDGVHLAHRELIHAAGAIASAEKLPLVVFTFPAESALKPSSPRLYSTKEKLLLLENAGADYVLLADFSQLSELSAEDFAIDFLMNRCGAHYAVCGYNFTFGHGKCGDAPLLARLFAEHGRGCHILGEYRLSGQTLSTSYIRGLLDKRDFETAARALGEPYFLLGEVSHGMGFGRTMELPTVNIPLSQGKYIPPRGVYVSCVPIEGKPFLALTNIGTCPTFGERELHSETYILNFDGDLYGEEIKVYLIKHLRDEKCFPNRNSLISQINIDKNEALRFACEVSWQELGLK